MKHGCIMDYEGNIIKDEFYLKCYEIVDNIELMYDGDLYECPHCYELVTIEYLEEFDEYMCGNDKCEEVFDIDHFDRIYLNSLYDDVLEVFFHKDAYGNYIGVELQAEHRGENITIDTAHAIVRLYRGCECVEVPLRKDVAAQIAKDFENEFNRYYAQKKA